MRMIVPCLNSECSVLLGRNGHCVAMAKIRLSMPFAFFLDLGHVKLLSGNCLPRFISPSKRLQDILDETKSRFHPLMELIRSQINQHLQDNTGASKHLESTIFRTEDTVLNSLHITQTSAWTGDYLTHSVRTVHYLRVSSPQGPETVCKGGRVYSLIAKWTEWTFFNSNTPGKSDGMLRNISKNLIMCLMGE